LGGYVGVVAPLLSRRSRGGGGTLDVVIRDWGVGLGGDVDVEGLFRLGQKKVKFDRVEHQTSYAQLPHDPMEGVGVGLALSRVMARRDGGDVELRSVEGGGAEFVLTIKALGGKRLQQFLHVAPCGDAWVSGELFAAKHLNNDYVRSFGPVEEGEIDVEEMSFEELNELYDRGSEVVTPWEVR